MTSNPSSPYNVFLIVTLVNVTPGVAVLVNSADTTLFATGLIAPAGEVVIVYPFWTVSETV